MTFLRFDRTVYGHQDPSSVARSQKRRVLLESLMDVLLLARVQVLAGPMFSAFTRLALQMRVQGPIPLSHYAALDGYPWCTRTSCKANYVESYGTVRLCRGTV